MYSYGPPHMAVQKQDDQHEHTFSSYVRIRDVVLKTCLGRWTIGRSGERSQGYPCYQRDMMMMMIIANLLFMQVSRTVLSFLADLNAIAWRVSIRPLITKSSSPCTNPLVSVPSAPITIDFTVNFLFHSFFSFQARSIYWSLFSLSFSFTLWTAGTTNFTIR